MMSLILSRVMSRSFFVLIKLLFCTDVIKLRRFHPTLDFSYVNGTNKLTICDLEISRYFLFIFFWFIYFLSIIFISLEIVLIKKNLWKIYLLKAKKVSEKVIRVFTIVEKIKLLFWRNQVVSCVITMKFNIWGIGTIFFQFALSGSLNRSESEIFFFNLGHRVNRTIISFAPYYVPNRDFNSEFSIS